LQGVAHVQWENHRALVCLIGENIRRQPDVARRAFAAVAELDVHTVCQGASERTISFLVEASQVEESVQRLHAVFFPKLESEPVPRREQPPQDWGGISSAFCQAG
jgi:aspartate kinase